MLSSFPPPADRIPDDLKICQRARDALQAGKLENFSQEEIFYVVATGVETIADERLDELFASEYAERLKEIRTRHGLEENKYWAPGSPKIPEEYESLLSEFRQEKRRVLGEVFRKYGEEAMAVIVESDPDAYQRQKNTGKEKVLQMGSPPNMGLQGIEGILAAAPTPEFDDTVPLGPSYGEGGGQ